MTSSSSCATVLSQALEFGEPEARAAFVAAACGGDEELRREIESLIQAHLAADSFLEPKIIPEDELPVEHPGDRIGRYWLCEMIGEGGFGRVWLAEQLEPVRRKVALKIVKLGMDTREVLARFKIERQALALMNHPNIARVYDGGATDSGRPYFVMELVDGTPITKYCVEHRLDLRQRLELFIDVALAVQHAHQKGVIHRDLKPSNILVSTLDGKPVVKVIDFGVAKAVSMELTGSTVMTAFGRMIGTPEYMSPEQAELFAFDIDTRSDIYALGVLLYELLTGTTPLDPVSLRKTGFAEMQRMICEEKPLKPSTRLAQRRQQAAAAPGGREEVIGREIDWVVMQALEKDRTRRYQTANGLALDVRRFLDDEPVSASPPSATYRMLKFAKRHRLAAAWMIVFIAAVFVVAIGMTFLYFIAEKRADKASVRRSIAEKKADVASERRSEAESRTWEALMAEATALRWSPKSGRRFAALEALDKAFAISSESSSPVNMKRLRDSTIACLAISDMQPVAQWKEDTEYGEMVAVAPAFTSYATTAADGRIFIHAYPGRTLQREIPGAGKPVSRVLGFSPDGSRLAAGYGSGAEWQMMLWDRAGVLPPLDLGQGINRAFAFFPGGDHCAIGRPDGTLVVADLSTGKPLQQIMLDSVPEALAVSRDGRFIAACSTTMAKAKGGVEILDVSKGVRIASLSFPALSVAWSPKEDSLAVGCCDRALRVWHDLDWSSPLALEGALGHTEAVDGVAWSPDGRLLLSQSGDGTMRLWDPFQGIHLGMHLGRGCNLELVEQESRVLVMTRSGSEFKVMQVVAGDVCYRGRKHSGDRGVADGAWNPGGNLLATSGDDGVRFWNREGRQLAHLKVAGARGLAFSADSFFLGSASGVHRYRMSEEDASGELVIRFQAAEEMGALEDCEQLSLWREGGMLAAVARGSGRSEPAGIWILDLKGGSEPRRLEMPTEVAYCSISPDGRWVAAGNAAADGVRIWSMADTATPVDLPTHGSARVVFSPDSKSLVTCDTDLYRFWNTDTWQKEGKIASQMGGTSGIVCFSPRGTVLIIAYHRAELKVILVKKLLEVCSPDFDRETPLCFDPEGRLMITVSPSGGVFFWRLDAIREDLDRMRRDWSKDDLAAFDAFHYRLLDRVVLPLASP